MATLPYVSFAVTRTVCTVPAGSPTSPVISRAAAAAAVTVDCCVPSISPVACAVSVGLPALVSVYLKSRLLPPTTIFGAVSGVVPSVWKNFPELELVLDNVTERSVAATATGLPYASCRSTVIVPEVTPAVMVGALLVKLSWLAVAAAIGSAKVNGVRPEAVAVRDCEPAVLKVTDRPTEP